MAFHAFNFGKQLGIVGGGSTNTLPEIHASEADARPLYPWLAREPDSPIAEPLPVRGRKGYEIADPGERPIGGNPWINVGSGGGGGGGGTGIAGGGSISGPSVDPKKAAKADQERAERLRAILAGFRDPIYCQSTGTHTPPSDCCEEFEKELIAATLEQLLRDPRLQQYEGLVDCLLNSLKKLTVICPDEPPYDTINSKEYTQYLHQFREKDILSIPSGLTNDPRFVLTPLLASCSIPGTLEENGVHFDVFSILGIKPMDSEKQELCDLLKGAVSRKDSSIDLTKEKSYQVWGKYSVFDIVTGKIYRRMVDENGNDVLGPEIGDWGPCPIP